MADAEKKKTIEQLWYTWSDVGLSTVYAGARIRAASEGLSDIYSERVQSIDRYTRYTLPPGTDRYAITPQQAPVCLAYLRTSWDELILVHKQYIGLDGVGRPGNFFTHLFALGRDMDEISPAEAIWLWNSPIWKTSDAGLDRRSVKLEAVSLDDIEHAQTFSPTYIQVQQYLPFLIEAYLSRRASSPIYLAAPANASDMIANLIAGLAWCLPRQLLANLTFSTYEPDWSKATTQIVGVSWVPGAAKEQRPESGFTPQFYQEQLALNCATGECSHLERHPLALYSPLTAEFARFATDCLVYDEMEELNNLIEQAEQDPQLNLEMFLRLYSNLVVDKQHLRPGDIEEYLSSPSYRLARLADHTFREQIIDQTVQNQLWWQQRLKPILLTLRQQSERERSSHRGMEKQPLLAAPKQKKASSKEPRRRSNKRKAAADSSNALSLEQVLSQLARNAVPTIISTMKQLARSGMRSAADNIEEGVSVGAITTLLELMDSVLASDDPYGIWKSLCESILANADACRFLTEHWEIHSYLLQKWGKLLPAEKNEAQLQSALVIFWSHLGEFLALRLHQQHPQWVVLALQELLREKSGLTPLIVQQLEQQYAADVQSLLEAFIKDSNCWSIAVSFVITLSEKRYAGGQPYAALVESLLSGLISSSQWHLLAKDLVVAWTIAGYSGSDGYLRQVEQLLKSLLEHAQTQVAGRELFDQLARSTYRGKKRLVPIALNSPLFKGNLENVLQQLFPNLEELNDFFISDGSNYLQGHRETMFGVYQKLLPLPDRWQRLSKLLDFSIEENYVFQVWGVAQLMDAEIATVLKKYGASYLSNYQYGPHLAQTVIKQFAFLVERNYSVKELLFALFTITQSTYLEALLSIAQPKLSLDDIRAFFNEYGTLPQYYFFFSEQSPALIWLLRTYLQNSAAWQLEDPASRKFLLSLAQQTKLHKALDANESKWLVIVSFLERPDISSSRLTRLVTALYQSPSDASAVIPELAQAFVKCVGSVSDLNSILLEMYKGSPNVDVYLLFYAIAQHAAETYYQRLNGLIPYAIFALTCSLEGQNSTGRTHFVQVFLDRLLYYITNLSAWKSLHASLCAQQPALPEHALAQWQNYLRGLQLLEQVQSGQPVQPVATTDQEKGSPVPTGGIRGLWRRLLKKDFSTAELKVREALVGRKITRIVNTYQRLTQLEPESYQLRFYQGLSSVEKERLRVACDFSRVYENALKKKGVFRLETERQLDSLRERIENLNLECTKKQQKRLREALGHVANHVAEADSQRLVAQSQSLDPSGLATQKSLPVTQSSVPAQQEQERYSYELPENRSGLHKLFPPLRKKKPGK